jgi:hypothetical protein
MQSIPSFRHASRVLLAMSVLWGAPSLAAGQAPSDAPAQLTVDDVDGHYITLTWEPPADEVVQAYIVEGGFGRDEVAGSLSVGAETTSVTVPLPGGVYFIRTYAVIDGQRSAPSNEVQVAVAMPTPPAVPESFAGAAVGDAVVLTWRNAFTGGTPETMMLEVTGPISGSLPLPPTGSFRVAGVPNGTYTIRLRAANGAGQSDATAPITVSLPGPVPVVSRGPATSPDAPRLPVRYEWFSAPRLDQLRARERLDAVIAGSATEFEALLRLKDWVAAQFPHSDPIPYPPWDAMIILDQIRAGITGGFCAQYSQVLLQSLASLGVPARYVEIGTVDNPVNHFPIEAWSNDFGKWVLLDADFNIHFEKDGVPLSAVEVHDAYVSGAASGVTVVEGTAFPGHPRASEWPHRTMEVYYYLRYPLKANHVVAPFEEAFDRLNDSIEFLDARTVPWEQSTVESTLPKTPLTTRSTTSRAFADAPLNDLWVAPWTSGPAEVTLGLSTSMPNVAWAEYRVIDAQGVAGPWRQHFSPLLTWPVNPGERAIEVRAVNSRGVAGAGTTVSLVAP